MGVVVNPFLVKRYQGPAYFCDREDELIRLCKAIENGRDVTLLSQRRMGKSGLLKHLQYTLEKQNKTHMLYTDVFKTTDIYGFARALSLTLISHIKQEKKLLSKIADIFKSVRPMLSINPLTAEPEVSIDFGDANQAWNTLDDIFNYIKSKDETIVWAIDEFQQINQYPDGQRIEATLRTYIQEIRQARFIFSGSKVHMLQEMFHAPNRPFYQSTDMLFLKEIPMDKYQSFIAKHFKKSKMHPNPKVLDLIMERTLGHTWYVQMVCNKLYELGIKELEEMHVHQVLNDIFKTFEQYYFTYRDILSKGQWNLLKALAQEGKVEKPTASNFLREHHLKSSAAVSKTLPVLLDLELIIKVQELENSYYRVADVFFMRWIQTIY